MAHRIRCVSPAAALLVLCAAFGGCSSRTDVSLSGNAPAQFSHVWLTTQQVWFNTSATAGPDDTGWAKFTLATPVTLDLVSESNGTLGQIATALRVTAGTYSQVRLIPLDPTAALAASAQSAGALYNAEADYVDSAGTAHQVPLELLNPDKGLGIQTSLTVPLGSLNTSSSATNSSTTGSSSSTTTKTLSIAITVDGAHDLAMFTYGTQTGVLLSAHPAVHDLSLVGAIQGTLTTTGLTAITGAPNRTNLQVTAESLSSDGTRHVIVNSTAVGTDGSFVLYPLATTSSTPATYDLVIHGPAMATIVIKSVQVTVGDATNAVSIGTLTPRAASAFTVNLTPAPAAPLPAGALVGFYQTLPASGEVPYVIEAGPVDPFNSTFANAQSLSTATIDSGTYAASGQTITLTSATPAEGAGTYRVSASAPLFADGLLTTTVSAPASATTSAVLVTVPTLTVAPGVSLASISAAVSQATRGKYDRGELIVTHDGAVIDTVALDAALAQTSGGSVLINRLPAGTGGGAGNAALYYLTVRAWNSSDPAGTSHRQWYSTPIDLRNGNATAVQLTID